MLILPQQSWFEKKFPPSASSTGEEISEQIQSPTVCKYPLYNSHLPLPEYFSCLKLAATQATSSTS